MIISLAHEPSGYFESTLHQEVILLILSDSFHGLTLVHAVALLELHSETLALLSRIFVDYDVFVGQQLCIREGQRLVGLLVVFGAEEVDQAALCIQDERRFLWEAVRGCLMDLLDFCWK